MGVSLLLLVALAASSDYSSSSSSVVDGAEIRDSMQLDQNMNGNGGIQPYEYGYEAFLESIETKGKKKCKTKKPCSKIGGECTKKKTCDGDVMKVKNGCSKGCECCLPLVSTTPFPTTYTTTAAAVCLTTDDVPCVFPFRYQGVLYDGCTTVDHDQYWCSTQVDENGDHVGGEWGNCKDDCNTDDDDGTDDYFICNNDRHIPGWWICDGYDDCGDESDETHCSSCQAGEIKCPSGECIREAWKCDGFEDCADASDEKECGQITEQGGSQTVAPHSCTGFTCKNGRCIISSWKCDGYDDCGDNSDETGCNKCSSTQFTCVSDGKCIAGSWKCDKYKDCSDGSDEADCKAKCKSDQFQCVSSGKCIYGSWKCDNYKDCDDGSDEKDCQKCTSTQFECTNKKCVSSSSKCNGKDDCGDNSDEENCPTTCQCGIPNASRIVNGVEVNPKRKYPWQIGLVSPGYYISCGGSIINDRWILTAAHCVVDKNTCRIKYDSSSSIRVALGEHNQFQTTDDDSNTKKYAIKTYIKHPNYNCKTLDYDFALLELTEAIPFNNVIRPICLPKDDSKTYVGQTATVSGWGLSGTGGSMSHFLKEVNIPVLANDKCGDWYTLAAMKICAGQTGKNSCGGDSGGPLAVIENNKYVQVGVVSYGHRSGCASSSYPSVYARVSKVISWINSNTGNGKKCN